MLQVLTPPWVATDDVLLVNVVDVCHKRHHHHTRIIELCCKHRHRERSVCCTHQFTTHIHIHTHTHTRRCLAHCSISHQPTHNTSSHSTFSCMEQYTNQHHQLLRYNPLLLQHFEGLSFSLPVA